MDEAQEAAERPKGPPFGTWVATGTTGWMARNVFTDEPITRFALARCYVRIEMASGRVLEAPYEIEEYWDWTPEEPVALTTFAGQLWRFSGAQPERPTEPTRMNIWWDMFLFPNTMIAIESPSGPIFANQPSSTLSMSLWSTGEVPQGCNEPPRFEAVPSACPCGANPDGSCLRCEDPPAY